MLDSKFMSDWQARFVRSSNFQSLTSDTILCNRLFILTLN